MRFAFFAVLLAAVVAVPAQASSSSTESSACGCNGTLPEAAPDPVNLELARILVATVSPRKDAKQDFSDQMVRMAHFDRIADTGVRDSVQAEFATLLVRIDPIVERHFDAAQEASAMAYARKFTAAELKATTAFASTPEGKTVLSRIFELSYDTAVREEQALLMAEIAPAMADFQVAVCKRKTALRVAAGDKKAKCSLG